MKPEFYAAEKFKQFLSAHWAQILAFVLVLVFIVCSLTVLADTFTDPETYRATIASIDEKKLTVLGVSSAITGTATLLAAVPEDATTPVAEELMDLSGYLLAVVCVLVLEKSLLTVFGAAACYILFPVAGALALVFIVKKKPSLISWAIKLSALALAFLMIVPCSMRLSDYIYEVNHISIETDTNTTADTETQENTDEKTPWYNKLWNTVTDAVTNAVDTALEKGKQALNDFIDAVSVFVIAYCAIPVFIVFLLLWLLKILFGIKINVTADTFHLNRLRARKKAKESNTV